MPTGRGKLTLGGSEDLKPRYLAFQRAQRDGQDGMRRMVSISTFTWVLGMDDDAMAP